MLRMRSLALAAVPALIGLLPLTQAHAAGVLLRYHFTPGEVITYKVTVSSVIKFSLGGKASPTATDRTTYLTHYTISSITEGGTAMLSLRTDHIVDVFTEAGKTTRSTAQPSTQTFLQENNGRQDTPDNRFHGAYSNGDLGRVPNLPAAVGATWTNTLTDRPNIYKPNTVMNCQNTLARFLNMPQRVADIHTTCAIQGHGQETVQGILFRFAATDTMTGSWHFAVKNGRFLSQLLHETTTEVGTAAKGKTSQPFIQHMATTTTQTLVSVSTTAV